TILVTDDRPVNRQFLVTLLGYRGHRVIEAGDGAQALKLVRAERPELVITDIVMPVMDGYQFLRALRCDPELSSTRVIVLSADYLEAEARALTRACGVSHFLTKPVEPAQMLAMVDLTLAEAPPRAIQEATLDEYVLKEHLRQLGSRLYQKVQELEARNEILDQQLGEHTRALA